MYVQALAVSIRVSVQLRFVLYRCCLPFTNALLTSVFRCFISRD